MIEAAAIQSARFGKYIAHIDDILADQIFLAIISIAKTKLKKVKKEKWQYNAKIVQFYSNIL